MSRVTGHRALPALRRAARNCTPVIGALLAWWFLAELLGPSRLPGPYQSAELFFSTATRDAIIEAQGGGAGGYLPHVASTAGAVLLTVTCSALLGIPLALIIHRRWWLNSLATAVLGLSNGLPPLIFVPFAAISLAGSEHVRTMSIFLYSIMTLLVYALNALSQIDRELIALARLLGAGPVRIALTVQLPAMAPLLLGPLRLIASFALGISVVTEYLVSPSGIGRVMKYALAFSDVGLIVVGVIWAVLIAFAFDVIVILVFSLFLAGSERRALADWLAAQQS